MKITNHTELRRKVSHDCSKPILTDQSHAKSTDINNIMLQYTKTGLLPVQQEKVAHYIDNTKIPSLMDAHAQIREAKEMFYSFPAQVRKMMDNDPTKLVDFLRDPDNKEILLKYKLISPRKPKVEPSAKQKADPASREPAEQKE